MEKATKLITELKHKIKEYELKFTEPTRLLTRAKTEPLASEMEVDMVQAT